MKNINILSSHTTLAEAVKLSGYNVSYNPAEYSSKIKNVDKGSAAHNLSGTTRAFIVEGYEYGNPVIMYTVTANGASLLHKFTLSGCLSSDDFSMCIIDEANKVITTTGVTYAKSTNGRKAMAAVCDAAKPGMIAFA
jgi:hypothetical protein